MPETKKVEKIIKPDSGDTKKSYIKPPPKVIPPTPKPPPTPPPPKPVEPKKSNDK